jgi:hypothetical protein
VKRILAIFITMLMLTTNVGLTFASHFCGGMVVKSTFLLGQSAIGCGMSDTDAACEISCESSEIQRKNCCENTYKSVTINDDYNRITCKNPDDSFKFIAAFINSYTNLYSLNTLKNAEYFYYLPPLLKQNFQVINQSFLI